MKMNVFTHLLFSDALAQYMGFHKLLKTIFLPSHLEYNETKNIFYLFLLSNKL